MDPKMDKKEKVATALKWGLGVVAAVLVSPIVFLALKGALGILAIGVAGAVGLGLIRMAPVASMMVSNLIMKLIIREAAANPIETMLNLKTEKESELTQADSAIIAFETEVRNYDDQAASFAEQYPEEAASFNEISSKMHEALKLQKEQQDHARIKLVDLGQRIEKARAIYKMSLAAQHVTSLSKSSEEKVFQDIKEKIAFETVRSELNSSFASLNMALSQRKTISQQALPAKRNVIEITTAVKEKEKVSS